MDVPRWCRGCETWQPLGEFAVDRSKASGRKSRCKACDRAKSRRYYADHRDERAAYSAARRERGAATAGAPQERPGPGGGAPVVGRAAERR